MTVTIEVLPQDKTKLRKRFEALIKSCDWLDVAVAWAGDNDVLDAAIKHADKLRHVVIGTHLYHTSPYVLRTLMSVRSQEPVRYVPPDGDLFHPKIYVFGRDEGPVAIAVGSHNWTRAAFSGRNVEAGVLLSGAEGDPPIGSLAGFVEEHWVQAKEIGDDFIDRYAYQYILNRRRRAALQKKVPPQEKGQPNATIGSGNTGVKEGAVPLGLSWRQYATLVRSEPNRKIENRLAILATARRLFSSKTFRAMSPDERRCLAGTMGSTQPLIEELDWGWFGTVTSGGFKSVVLNHPERLSIALNKIPLTGKVSNENYNAFVEAFEVAFKDQERAGRVPCATRLLAMKRPDVFVCVNGANRKRLCSDLDVAPSTLSLQKYWDAIVVPIQASPWWQAPKPKIPIEEAIWRGRTALLDGLYYEAT